MRGDRGRRLRLRGRARGKLLAQRLGLGVRGLAGPRRDAARGGATCSAAPRTATPPMMTPTISTNISDDEQRRGRREHRRLRCRTDRARPCTGARFATANATMSSASGTRMSSRDDLADHGCGPSAVIPGPPARRGPEPITTESATIATTEPNRKICRYGVRPSRSLSSGRAMHGPVGPAEMTKPPTRRCSAARAFPCRS